MVSLVFCEHSRYAISRKAHIDIKRNGNIPWAIILVLILGTHFQFEVLNVVNACKDDGLECGNDIPS